MATLLYHVFKYRQPLSLVLSFTCFVFFSISDSFAEEPLQISGHVTFGDEQWTALSRSAEQGVVSDLVLSHGTVVELGSNSLVLHANRLRIEGEARIVAFPDEGKSAVGGTNGANAGSLTIFANEIQDGALWVDFKGQNGGKGADLKTHTVTKQRNVPSTCTQTYWTLCSGWWVMRFPCPKTRSYPCTKNESYEAQEVDVQPQNGGNGGTGGHFALHVRDVFNFHLATDVRGGGPGEGGSSAPGYPTTAPGTPGSHGSITLLSLGNHLPARRCLEGEIAKVNGQLEIVGGEFRQGRDWIDFWFNHQYEFPYKNFNPERHAGADPAATNSAFLELLASHVDGRPLNDTQKKFLREIRWQFVAMFQNEVTRKAFEDASAVFMERLRTLRESLDAESKWEAAIVLYASDRGVETKLPQTAKETIIGLADAPGTMQALQYKEVFPQHDAWLGQYDSGTEEERENICKGRPSSVLVSQ